MSSFQQISIGIILLAGAFVFGHFLTNQTNTASPEQTQTEFTAAELALNSRSATETPVANHTPNASGSSLSNSSANPPTLQQSLRERIMGKRRKMTPKIPPLALDNSNRNPSPFILPSGSRQITRAKEPTSDAEMEIAPPPSDVKTQPERTHSRLTKIDEIVVPDFSKLDALAKQMDMEPSSPPKLLQIDRSNNETKPPSIDRTEGEFTADSRSRIPPPVRDSTQIVVGKMSLDTIPRQNPQPRQTPPSRARSAPARIPFGLTDKAKSELVRIQKRKSISYDNSKYVMHQTHDGDTLHSLSQKFYGKPDFYLDIYLANQRLLDNPSSVPSGITVKIPMFD